MIETELDIINKYGLHARSTAKLVAVASSFGSTIKIGKDDKLVDAKSIMAVMLLAAKKGTTLKLIAEGDDAGQAIAGIKALAANYFDEGE